jgi:hypothetical protein
MIGKLLLSSQVESMFAALFGVMRHKNPTPNPLPASDEGAKM